MESLDIAKEIRSKIDNAHESEEKYEKSQGGDIKDDNLSVASERCVMVALDKENIDDEENSTVSFGSVHLSHTQELCNDLMEQELNPNGDKNMDLYSKMLNTVPYFAGNSKDSTMMMEQSVWCESTSSSTP